MPQLVPEGPTLTESEVSDALSELGVQNAHPSIIQHFVDLNGADGSGLAIGWGQNDGTASLVFHGIGWEEAELGMETGWEQSEVGTSAVPFCRDGVGNLFFVTQTGAVSYFDLDVRRLRSVFDGLPEFMAALEEVEEQFAEWVGMTTSELTTYVQQDPRRGSIAAGQGRLDVISVLLQHPEHAGAYINAAASESQLSMIQALVDGGFDVNATMVGNRNALTGAGGGDSTAAFDLLMSLGIDPFLVDDWGRPAWKQPCGAAYFAHVSAVIAAL